MEHLAFSLVEGHPRLAVQAAGVLEVLAETLEVELGGNLVVLLVRRLCLLRHRSKFEVVHEVHLVFQPIFGVLEVEQAFGPQEEPDTSSKHERGHEVPFDQLFVVGFGDRKGDRGQRSRCTGGTLQIVSAGDFWMINPLFIQASAERTPMARCAPGGRTYRTHRTRVSTRR